METNEARLCGYAAEQKEMQDMPALLSSLYYSFFLPVSMWLFAPVTLKQEVVGSNTLYNFLFQNV